MVFNGVTEGSWKCRREFLENCESFWGTLYALYGACEGEQVDL